MILGILIGLYIAIVAFLLWINFSGGEERTLGETLLHLVICFFFPLVAIAAIGVVIWDLGTIKNKD